MSMGENGGGWTSVWTQRGARHEVPDLEKTKHSAKRGENYVQAESQRPIGRHESVWSQMTRRVAVMGMANSRPMPPQTQPQKSSEMVMATALRRTRRPTNCGATKFSATT